MGTLSFLARRFVAGERMTEALEAVRLLNIDGVTASLDILGENVSNKAEANAAAQEYIELLHAIDKARIHSNVSLKLTQMGLEISEEFCISLMRRILEAARDSRNFVRLDMESSAYTERTIRVFTKLFEEFSNVGIVLQAYLHRSEEDAKRMAALRAPVRVCKGAYKESSAIAFQSMDDIRRNYQRMVEILLKGGSKVGIATHDEKLIRWAHSWTQQEKIGREQFEFQMLYGLRRARARQIAKDGFTMRAYVPYGTQWLPYFVRRLRERKENIFFVLKSLVAD